MSRDFSLHLDIDPRWRHLPQAVLIQELGDQHEVDDLEGVTWLLLQGLQGRCSCLMAGEETPIETGRVLIVPRRRMPSLRLETGCRLLVFGFRGGDSQVSELLSSLPQPCTLSPSSQASARLQGFRRLAGDQTSRLSLIDSAMLVQSVLAALAHHAEAEDDNDSHLLRQAKRLLQQHAEGLYDGQALARQLGVSPQHLCRVFTEATGIAPGQYHKKLRLNHGARFLRGSSLSITEIAERCGYGTQTAFARAFRSVYGMSPAEYRDHGSVSLL